MRLVPIPIYFSIATRSLYRDGLRNALPSLVVAVSIRLAVNV